jgi:hypothetical protein
MCFRCFIQSFGPESPGTFARLETPAVMIFGVVHAFVMGSESS